MMFKWLCCPEVIKKPARFRIQYRRSIYGGGYTWHLDEWSSAYRDRNGARRNAGYTPMNSDSDKEVLRAKAQAILDQEARTEYLG